MFTSEVEYARLNNTPSIVLKMNEMNESGNTVEWLELKTENRFTDEESTYEDVLNKIRVMKKKVNSFVQVYVLYHILLACISCKRTCVHACVMAVKAGT
jgi:hypothetical protein